MKRADRLYRLMSRLQDGRIHRAEDLARETGVSLRTIYRDMEVLAASGVPVEGARGEGYSARAAITLPPLNLTETELEALHLGLAAVGASDMVEMAEAARTLSAKIEAVLPEDTGMAAERFGFATYPFAEAAEGFRHMPAIRRAIRARQKLRASLRDESEWRDLRPLHVDYWGRVWTCIAWDEGAGDFTRFRIDRVVSLVPLPGLFVDEPGKGLADYRARDAQSV
ncbi:bifunctional biotin--[acetyl-CoA-carboxylase] synthetase/biotin operon repressor [Roseivivax jejudonensis]|uniref:Bifunctional biotin--[acetyl-CoA-carboxylase] synthetase/biotin operon repressor n=1 Tax=Roseivivax jejudonensis TaxID=1529041 RepID=A0A1X6Z2W5_9RHOB|nr:YafY family protein [Roseivivax jejudonensis]SLN38933.1 bifunctional biotin--[acetyl-CoA-carboxylase] synthetase/biotin operon repressor [Roseivivax jejudonensis]